VKFHIKIANGCWGNGLCF